MLFVRSTPETRCCASDVRCVCDLEPHHRPHTLQVFVRSETRWADVGIYPSLQASSDAAVSMATRHSLPATYTRHVPVHP